jgi:hypothetical protein
MRAGLQQPADVGWIVRQVGVHLDDVRGIRRERGLHPVDVGTAEAARRFVVKDGYAAAVRRGEPVRLGASAVRGAVVHDQHAHPLNFDQGGDQRRQVRALVVCRDDDERT